MDDPLRGTGRTIGLMLKAIGEALLHHCTWVEFVNHHEHRNRSDAESWLEVLELLCIQLGLQFMRIRTRGNRVWIISLAPTRTTEEAAVVHPECPPLPNEKRVTEALQATGHPSV
ncbi:hypothetical protein NA78x_001744 [Anatilimnocola sp. NA78]|uniref:hypothetical protein n=1 Tax=Anatilimnocola sp. NA78 TaxID=3415683 RepID=UPI003CE4B73A